MGTAGNINKDKLNQICRDYGILGAYLFGSIAKKGADILKGKSPDKIDPFADIDLGIVFLERPLDAKQRIKIYSKLYTELSEVFYPFTLDLVFLQETGVILQFEAINGTLVYSHDDDLRLDYEERVVKFYQDWKPVYDKYTNEVLEAISNRKLS